MYFRELFLIFMNYSGYNSALKKLTQAFVEGKTIFIKGGNIEFDKDWYKCKKCFRLIEGLENHTKCEGCKRFGTEELIKIDEQIDDI